MSEPFITVLGVECEERDEDSWAHETDERGVYVRLNEEHGTYEVREELGLIAGDHRGYAVNFYGCGPTIADAEADCIAQRLELVRRLTGGAA